MTRRHRLSVFVTCSLGAVVFGVLSGCAPAKGQQFRTYFVPPAPRSDGPDAEVLSEPPSIPKEYLQEVPQPIALDTIVAKSSTVEQRLRRADEKFAEGKTAYQAGDLERARTAFNQVVDLLLSAPENVPDRAKLERRLDQMVDAIYRYDVNGMGAGEDPDKVVFDKATLDSILEMTFSTDPRLKPKVREEVLATASQLPLDENDAVISYIRFFSSEGGKRILKSGLRRAGRYRSLIERVLADEGVPQELIYLAQAESGFLPRAVSYKQCAGMWQFDSWRGKSYGLSVGRTNDERLDPEKATRAAAKHLHDLYQQFGDWYLAMAAYNCGPYCVDRAVQRTGYADFWALRNINALPKETQNYVPAILAITIMAKNPKDYGLEDIETDRPMEYDTVKVEAPTNLALVADAVERPVSEIRELNPALMQGTAPESYELRIPKGTEPALRAALEAIPPAKRANYRMHRVEKGETLAAIGKRYGTPAAAILSANTTAAISGPEAGDVLLIPAAYREPVATPRRAVRGQRTVSRAAATTASRHPRTTAVKSASRKAPARTAPRQQVSSKVLHHRAPAARVRSASIGSSGAGQ